MVLSKKKIARLGILFILLGNAFPKEGFSAKNDAGFYAGPLSAVAETVTEVTVHKAVAPAPQESPEPGADEKLRKLERTDAE